MPTGIAGASLGVRQRELSMWDLARTEQGPNSLWAMSLACDRQSSLCSLNFNCYRVDVCVFLCLQSKTTRISLVYKWDF